MILFSLPPRRFDLILTDIRMPVMDGIQLVHLVRETRPTAKIVCMSGFTGAPPKWYSCKSRFNPLSSLRLLREPCNRLKSKGCPRQLLTSVRSCAF